MNIDWLENFVVVSETLNLQKASEKLHITPQAISKSISNLEKYLNTRLFDRGNSIKGLTLSGEILLEKSIEIIEKINNLKLEINETNNKVPLGKVKIGGDSMWQNYYLPDLIEKINLEYPQIVFRINTLLPEDIEKNILSGNIDIGLINYKTDNQKIEFIKVKSTPLVIVGKPQKKQSWKELKFIIPSIFNKKSDLSLDGWEEKSNYERIVVMEVESVETASIMASKGIGVALLPLISVEEKIKNKKMAIISDTPFHKEENLYICYRNDIHLSIAIKKIINFINQLLKKS
ncbi:MAG: LysR family transcriptional regulator [Cyanobacteriota bacterium]